MVVGELLHHTANVVFLVVGVLNTEPDLVTIQHQPMVVTVALEMQRK